MKPSLPACLILFVTLTLFGTIHPVQSAEPKPNQVIVKKLQQIIQIHEQMVSEQDILISAGRTKPDGGAAKIAWIRARIDLERELQQPDKIIKLLRELVAQHEIQLKHHEARQAINSPRDQAKARIALLKAQIQLERAISRMPKTKPAK